MRGLDARVAAEAAVGRHHVRRVAREKDAAVAEALGGVRLALPLLDGVDGRRDVFTQADAQQVATVGLAEAPAVGVRTLGVARGVDDEKARLVGLLDAEEAAERGVAHQDDAHVPPAHQRPTWARK